MHFLCFNQLIRNKQVMNRSGHFGVLGDPVLEAFLVANNQSLGSWVIGTENFLEFLSGSGRFLG